MIIDPRTFTLSALDRDEILAGLEHRAVALNKELDRLIKVRNAAMGRGWRKLEAAKESIETVEGRIARNSDLIKSFSI